MPVNETVVSHVAAKSPLSPPDLSSLDQAVQDTMIVDPAPSEGCAHRRSRCGSAAQSCHRWDVAKALLAGGADVNAIDRFGYTPLLYAATIDFGDADAATALLDPSADPNVKEKTGKTALAPAQDYP